MNPGMFPPGRAMCLTKPAATGSTETCMKMIGIVLVRACRDLVSVVPVETRTSGRRATSSFARWGRLAKSPFAQRSSISRVSPSRQPSARRLSFSIPAVFCSLLSPFMPPDR